MAIDLSEFDAAVDDVLSDFIKESHATRQKALSAAAEVMTEKLKAASPRGKKKFADKWKVKKYNDLQVVHNTATVDGGGKKNIPLANILEFKNGSPHYGFIRRTEQAAESEVINTIIKNLEVSENG